MPADPYQDVVTPYNASIQSLYDNLKKGYTDTAASGLAFNQSMIDNANTNAAAAQAQNTAMFNADDAKLTGMGTAMNAPGQDLSGLMAIRERLTGLGNTLRSAATDRAGYMGNLQSQYLNRLGDSASATGAMHQAALISAVGKLKAENDLKMAQIAQQAALQRAASRRSGGGGGGGGTGGDTITGTQNLTAQQAYVAMSDPAQQAYKKYSNLYGDNWISQATQDNDYAVGITVPGYHNWTDPTGPKDNLSRIYYNPEDGGFFSDYAASKAPWYTDTTAQKFNATKSIYPELAQFANALNPLLGNAQLKSVSTAKTKYP